MAALSERVAPYTGFAGVHFGVLRDESSTTLPDWEPESVRRTRHVPGSDRNITQFMGRGPLVVTWRLWLETRAEYRALEALLQTTGVLTAFERGTTADGTVVTIHGVRYVELADVALTDLKRKEVFTDDTVEVDATFELSNP